MAPSLAFFPAGFVALLVQSVMYSHIHSLLLSKRASPAKKMSARSLARKPPCQAKKILRHPSFGLIPGQPETSVSPFFQTKLAAIFRESK
jgi:hypothetical protein